MKNYQLNWTKNLKNNLSIDEFYDKLIFELKQDRPRIIAFDTETTGLNIMQDKPFLLIVAWKVPMIQEGKTWAIEWDAKRFKEIMSNTLGIQYIIGANIKYDLHMFRNGGAEIDFKNLGPTQLTDIQILRRLTIEADDIGQAEKLGLKHLTRELIDDEADYESGIKEILHKDLVKKNAILNGMVKPYKWTAAKFKDAIESLEIDDKKLLDIYKYWKENYPLMNYQDVFIEHRSVMEEYALNDGIYTIEVFLNLYAKLMEIQHKPTWRSAFVNFDQAKIFETENRLIPIYYEQEKIGFNIDLKYCKESMTRMKEYLDKLLIEFNSIIGKEVTVNQHKELIKTFIEKWSLPEENFMVKGKMSFGKETVSKLTRHENKEIARAAQLISLIRTAIKWDVTYLKSYYATVLANKDNRLHPNTRQAGTVSGRVSGDFQQMPRTGIYDEDNNEIFVPRKMIIPSKNYTLVFQDFDQMELRVQANYIIQLGYDTSNICRMFIPEKCYHKDLNEFYQMDNPEHIKRIKDIDNEGNSLWYIPESQKPWVPTDPHGLHVKNAFGYDESHPDWKALRGASKTINFALNYGSGLNNLLTNPMLEAFDAETITKIFNSHKSSFPGVAQYQKKVNNTIKDQLAIPNKYGRLYLAKSSDFGYKYANYLIQGSCADLVKSCLVKIDAFFKANKAKSRVLLTVHDEIIWEVYHGEEHLIEQVRNILQTESPWIYVPLDCGTDISNTNWYEKKSY